MNARTRILSSTRLIFQQRRTMAVGGAANTDKPIFFGPFDVTTQVFYKTPLSFAVVNLKPLLPGHVLVSPYRVVPRLTDLSEAEITDLFGTVQKVQRMLARHLFEPSATSSSSDTARPEDGSFNIAVQDGRDAGQSVPHVHCHIIPRLPGNELGDGVYDRLASEEGNVGGALWDMTHRPQPSGHFPKIEDASRRPRSAEEMAEEANLFRTRMEDLDKEILN